MNWIPVSPHGPILCHNAAHHLWEAFQTLPNLVNSILEQTKHRKRNNKDNLGNNANGHPISPSKLWLFGYELGTTFGFNAMPIISMLQVDTTSIDLTRMGYGNIYLAKDPWTVSYFLQLDPIATATAYSDRTVAAGADKTFEVSDAKFVQTLGVTYRF